ncbi:sensor histidine kinase [Actinomarinicola tropica]|uniref:histidine kinase n=1 Tax=Actinomarinicola tropica TaxID=2789776 RepID=A0A5Q2RMJ6_9ACTN|nr:histidine kinase [Actinomarinicola tropica]QGG96694.1 sensor histidine kinase [Actinomarinicola tropica]
MTLDKGRPYWAEPRAADPPGPARRDWLLVAVVVVAATIETFAREDLVWSGISLVATVGVACLLPWRRVHPLVVLVAAFGTMSAIDVVALVLDVEWEGLNSAAVMLVLPYALTRWAAGREVGIGLLVMAVPLVLTAVDGQPAGDVVGGTIVLLLACAIGFAVRYAGELRAEEIAGLRSREREELARELHDTVAHHVSAIAVRAQAGRVVATARPEAAVDALSVIEEEATRALEEMRSMVGALRGGDQAVLRPQQGVRDLARLAQPGEGHGPRVTVTIAEDLGGLRPAVDAACFRLAQEAVTNALRHARRASMVQVRVDGDAEHVRLTVDDDGQGGGASGGATSGFGLVGMAERAKLLGGTFDAGPRPDGGWTVAATIPRRAVTT